jgi:hypothetical protein
MNSIKEARTSFKESGTIAFPRDGSKHGSAVEGGSKRSGRVKNIQEGKDTDYDVFVSPSTREVVRVPL